MKNKKWSVYILLFLILALGLFLRIYNIENTPPGIYPDEAINGEDALKAFQNNAFQWFYPSNTGREGLFMNLIALCFKFFGVGILTLKLPAILSGTLVIFGTFLLGREIFNKRIGFISSFLVAVSFWPLNFSRIAFRANLLPLVLVFSFYFLWRGLRTRKIFDFAIGGLIFGIGLHTYIAFRIAPAILIVTLISLILSRQNFLKEYWKALVAFIIFAALSAAPMVYTFYAHPEYLAARSSISILAPDINQGHLIKTFFRSFGLSLAKYNFWGDQNWRHNYPPYPILDTLTGILFLFGFLYSLGKMLKLLYLRLFKKMRNRQMDIYVFLIFWFLGMLVPEFMTAEGNPHALRSIGTLPVVFLFSAFAFDFFLEKVENHRLIFRKLVFSLIILALLFIGTFNALKYHYFWANQTLAGLSFNKNLTDISKYIQILPKGQEKFVITSGNTLERLPIWLFTLNNNVKFFYPNEIGKINPQDPDNSIVFFTENNQNAKSELQPKFPNLAPKKVKCSLDSIYYILQ